MSEPIDQIEGYISLRHETVRGEWVLFFEFQPGTGSSLEAIIRSGPPNIADFCVRVLQDSRDDR